VHSSNPGSRVELAFCTTIPRMTLKALLQISAFREELAKLGWIEGRNIVIDLQAGDAMPMAD
jgi:hypothetical protein